MSAKKPARLPEPLRYLQPFVNSLAKLPPEDLNEDVDPTRLESALRNRLRGLDEEAADAELAKDRGLLERWLRTQADHPAHWVFGFLLSPDLVTHLTQPAPPTPRGPEMTLESPRGWKVKKVPFRLDLKADKVVGSIMAIDDDTFQMLQYQFEETAKLRHPEREETTEISAVAFGECQGKTGRLHLRRSMYLALLETRLALLVRWMVRALTLDSDSAGTSTLLDAIALQGKKYVYRLTVPRAWKDVRYVLSVPGGFVIIQLGTMTGGGFRRIIVRVKAEHATAVGVGIGRRWRGRGGGSTPCVSSASGGAARPMDGLGLCPTRSSVAPRHRHDRGVQYLQVTRRPVSSSVAPAQEV